MSGVVIRRAPTFGSQSLLHVGASLVSLFFLVPPLIIVISDFDTAPPGRHHLHSSSQERHQDTCSLVYALQPATIGSSRRNPIVTRIPLPHTNYSPLYAVSTWKLQEDILPVWTVPTSGANTHTHSMPAGDCESRSYSFSRQHEPIVSPKSSKLPKSYRTALFAALPRLACHWRLRLVLLVQVDGTSCVQYMLETWSTPEVRMFLPSYSFTIADRIFACRRSTLA